MIFRDENKLHGFKIIFLDCPLNLNPLIDSKTGVTVICPTGQSQCNVPGYGCQLGSAGVNVCCSEKSNGKIEVM